jgi:preprotein translocase subunit SecY
MPDPTSRYDDPDLGRRLAWTLAGLALFRLGLAIPLPWVSAPTAGPLGALTALAGGASGRVGILALGVLPLLDAEIVLLLLRALRVKAADARRGAWRGGLTAAFALLQAGLYALALVRAPASAGVRLAVPPGALFYAVVVATLTAGALFAAWLAERMTESGLANGAALIVFAGVAGRLDSAVWRVILLVDREQIGLIAALVFVLIVLAAVGVIALVETAQRKYAVSYAKRIVGRRMMGGTSSILPLKVEASGVVAAILAWAVLRLVPLPLPWALSDALLAALIVAFCWLRREEAIKPGELAENLRKSGGYIPGLRAGEATAAHLRRAASRLAFDGGVLAAAIVVLPDLLRRLLRLPFFLNGTLLLIAVGVSLDLMGQVEARQMMSRYESVLKRQRR